MQTILDILLAIGIIGGGSLVLIIPGYLVYRLIRIGFNKKGTIKLLGHSLVLLSLGTMIYALCASLWHLYDSSIRLVALSLLGLNIGLILSREMNIAKFAMQSKIHLTNVAILISLCLLSFLYNFYHVAPLKSFWDKSIGGTIIIMLFFYLNIFLWLGSVIKLWVSGFINDDFFSLNPKQQKIDLRVLETKNSGANDNNSNPYSLFIFERQASSEYAFEALAAASEPNYVLSLNPDSINKAREFPEHCEDSESKIDISNLTSILMPRSLYAVTEFEGLERDLPNYAFKLAHWATFRSGASPRGNIMFCEWLDKPNTSTEHVHVRIYCPIKTHGFYRPAY